MTARQFEDYHGYSIVHNHQGARLLTGDGGLAHPDTFDDLASAKSWVDSHLDGLKEDRRASHIGTVEGYLEALNTQTPSKKDYLMLSAHAAAPERRMSAQDLADLVGWKRDTSAKAHYSKLGKRIADQLDLAVDETDSQSPIRAIAKLDDDTGDWIMHPELAEALGQYSAA